MSRTPRVTGPELIAARGKGGFSILRVKGSHHFLRHEDGETIGPGLLNKILRDCRLGAEALTELLQKR